MNEDTISTDTFIQPKITGYRQLSDWDAQMMNVIKEHSVEVGKLVATLRKTEGLDQRWVELAADDLQKGFMALTRAVAQPTTF